MLFLRVIPTPSCLPVDSRFEWLPLKNAGPPRDHTVVESGGSFPVHIKGIRLIRLIMRPAFATRKRNARDDRFYDAFRDNLFTDALQKHGGDFGRSAQQPRDDAAGRPQDRLTNLVNSWNGRNPEKPGDRISAETACKNGSIDYRCPARIPAPSYLKSGDVISIGVKQAAEHAVLYAVTNVPFDGASEFWLVLRSASSCDECWSVYDP